MTDYGIKDLNEKKIGAEDYAPPPKRKVDLTEIERAMAEPAPKYPAYPPISNDPVTKLQSIIKELTHRQMKDMCKKIMNGADSVTVTELPDVLDRFAHGD